MLCFFGVSWFVDFIIMWGYDVMGCVFIYFNVDNVGVIFGDGDGFYWVGFKEFVGNVFLMMFGIFGFLDIIVCGFYEVGLSIIYGVVGVDWLIVLKWVYVMLFDCLVVFVELYFCWWVWCLCYDSDWCVE